MAYPTYVTMTYPEAVAKGVVPGTTQRIIKQKGNVSTTGITTFNTWTDHLGNPYLIVPAGKTFYIADMVITLADITGANTNSCSVAIGNAVNQPIIAELVSSGVTLPDVGGLLKLNAGDIPTVIFGIALSATEAAVTLLGWEE